MFGLTRDIGIDLGTASVLVYVRGKGVVLREPSVVAMDKTTGKLLKVGSEAQKMLGRTPGNIVAIRPCGGRHLRLRHDRTDAREFIRKVVPYRLFKPRMIICVPSGITEVEERSVIDAGIQAGARKVYLIEEPVAAAIGAGIDINRPDGHLVVDIGGGTSDIAVISCPAWWSPPPSRWLKRQVRRGHHQVYPPQAQCAYRRAHRRGAEDEHRLCVPQAGGGGRGDQGPVPDDRSAPGVPGVLQRDDRGL